MKEVDFMNDKTDTPLLLLDNSNMMSVINQGEFKCTNITFEETKLIVEMHDKNDLLLCFTNNDIETVIFDYLGIQNKEYPYKHIRNMRVGQDAIVFKLHTTQSETQPVIITTDGVEAKKIQNVYVYCQFLTRIK